MKKLLFVIESLVCAGAEKSLVNLLNTIDYQKYEVDLQLFSYGGEFEALLPKEVHLLPPLKYFSYCSGATKSTLGEQIKMTVARLRYSAAIRLKTLSNPQKAVAFWKCSHGCFLKENKHYDVAIAYAQGTPTFYVADCISAEKKLAWINSIYKLEGHEREYVSRKYTEYTSVVCVSEAGRQVFGEIFPEHHNKGVLIYDITNGDSVAQMSQLPSEAENQMNQGKWKILTVGRLAAQKGYDIALEACKILKERNIDFCWYALGRGSLEAEIRKTIQEYGIEKNFVLLGTASNPYPYYKQADIYVQTSRFEGFGLAIAEARMLNVPVVTTRFDAVFDQMVDGENGLVVDLTAQAVAEGILRLMEDKALYNHIVEYQSHEKKGNADEINKLYKLMGDCN